MKCTILRNETTHLTNRRHSLPGKEMRIMGTATPSEKNTPTRTSEMTHFSRRLLMQHMVTLFLWSLYSVSNY